MTTPHPPRSTDVEGGPPGGLGMVKLGCSAFVLGLLLVIITYAVGKASSAGSGWRPVGTVGLVLLFAGLGYLVVIGLIIRFRAARRARDGFAFAEPTQPDPQAIRRLEAARLPGTANWAAFPTNLIATARIFRGQIPITFSINLAKLVTMDRRKRPVEPPACYLWMPLPMSLPRLILRPDTRDNALLGRDLDIENEEFNRRFRVDSSPPGTASGADRVRYEDFAPYAHALLHPRAAQTLLQLPDVNSLVIDGNIIGVLDRPYTSQARVEKIADVLIEFVALIPNHVVSRWGR